MTSPDKVEQAERALAGERERLAKLRAASDSANRSADAATPGGLHGDMAIVSGIRRKRNPRADARRHAAYDRQAAASIALTEQERRVRVAEHRVEQARRDAAAPCDLDAVRPGWFVRNDAGWHRVVRVSAKSFSVETGYSWTDRIRKDRIIETRASKFEVVA